jgi:hypothetical protein
LVTTETPPIILVFSATVDAVLDGAADAVLDGAADVCDADGLAEAAGLLGAELLHPAASSAVAARAPAASHGQARFLVGCSISLQALRASVMKASSIVGFATTSEVGPAGRLDPLAAAEPAAGREQCRCAENWKVPVGELGET